MSYKYILKRRITRITKHLERRCFMCGKSFANSAALLVHNRTEKSCALKRDSLNEVQAIRSENFDFDITNDGSDISTENGQENPLLALQRSLLSRTLTGSVSPITVHKVFDVLTERKVQADWIDYLDLYYLIHTTALSRTDADEMIRTFSRMLFRKELRVVLPRSSRVIKKAVHEAVMSKFTYVNFKYNLPPEWFTEKYSAMDSVASGHFVTVMEVLAEMLIEIPVESFHFVPSRLCNEAGERIFREPATGHVFKEYCKLVRERFGEDVYPLVVVVNGDSLILNKTGDIKMTLT